MKDGDLETLNEPPSLTSRLDHDNHTRSTTGSVAPRAKEKLARLCGGRKCIVTHEASPHVGIEVAHLLPRSTDASLLAKLELAFGLRYRQMHIDTTGNLEHLKVELHRSFDHMGWFLLPELEVIEEIMKFTLARAGRTYKEVFSPATKTFKYRLVPLQLLKDNIGIWRRRSSDAPVSLDTTDHYHFPPPPVYDQIYPLGLHPVPIFESLPIIESRANPFFVIANAGPKLDNKIFLLPLNWISRKDIMTVNTIWIIWKSMKPTPEWRAATYQTRHPGNGRGGRRAKDGSQGPPERQDDSPALKRKRRSAARSVSREPSGQGLAHTMANLPELDSNHQSTSAVSDDLTYDAVRAVASLDRSKVLQNWLQEGRLDQ
ncbi:hypothetical protein B0H15DRAFT_135837 [Mycena belliarum]|uniref:HNH nuclease domain-containing protein n=1 Tax=Mycena belliarum TaxID=1033014 RepID=A0AAD6XX99_9AGAR|nr:hypothetical protein B0H15DRAFT_135837 [Mycena belliae]